MNSKLANTLVVCALFGTLLFSGCQKPATGAGLIEALFGPAGGPVVRHYTAGLSVENRPIECLILGKGADVTLIIATIHGDEPVGTPLVRHLAQYLRQHPKLLVGRTVVLMPAANPDGMARNSRYNVRGVDLNRNFATANRQNRKQYGFSALSEPETRTIERLISQYAPDRIVSIHQPFACIDYDGPAKELAKRMAEYSDLPVKKLGPMTGSLGSYAGLSLGIPIVTLELLSNDENLNQHQLWQRYGKMLLAAITYPQRHE